MNVQGNLVPKISFKRAKVLLSVVNAFESVYLHCQRQSIRAAAVKLN